VWLVTLSVIPLVSPLGSSASPESPGCRLQKLSGHLRASEQGHLEVQCFISTIDKRECAWSSLVLAQDARRWVVLGAFPLQTRLLLDLVSLEEGAS
jgi:hypothetical protein